MFTEYKPPQLLRRAAFSAVLLLLAAPAARADLSGRSVHRFRDSAPASTDAPTAPPHGMGATCGIDAPMENSAASLSR